MKSSRIVMIVMRLDYWIKHYKYLLQISSLIIKKTPNFPCFKYTQAITPNNDIVFTNFLINLRRQNYSLSTFSIKPQQVIFGKAIYYKQPYSQSTYFNLSIDL